MNGFIEDGRGGSSERQYQLWISTISLHTNLARAREEKLSDSYPRGTVLLFKGGYHNKFFYPLFAGISQLITAWG